MSRKYDGSGCRPLQRRIGLKARMFRIKRNFTLEYWIDDEWFVGRIKEVPGFFSQGENLEELEENIKDAFRLMIVEIG